MQAEFLVNSANTRPALYTAMNLPVDVVRFGEFIANPYDPEYGRLTGAVASRRDRLRELQRFPRDGAEPHRRPRRPQWGLCGH